MADESIERELGGIQATLSGIETKMGEISARHEQFFSLHSNHDQRIGEVTGSVEALRQSLEDERKAREAGDRAHEELDRARFRAIWRYLGPISGLGGAGAVVGGIWKLLSHG